MKNTLANPKPDIGKVIHAIALAVLTAACSSASAERLVIDMSQGVMYRPNYRTGQAYYRSESGYSEMIEPNANIGFGHGPDSAPGHLVFAITGSGGTHDESYDRNFQTNSMASSQWDKDGLRVSGGSDGDAGSFSLVQVTDTITFTNTNSGPQPATIRFVTNGLMVAGVMNPPSPNPAGLNTLYGSADVSSTLKFLGCAAVKDIYLSSNPYESDPYRNNFYQSGWTDNGRSYEIERPDLYSATFTGHFSLPPGETTTEIVQTLRADVRGNAGANYANTSGVQLIVPPGVSFTSESGKFLSGGSRLANISTRARVLGGDNVSIAGFIVTGNVPKKVIIRGVGPSLSGFVPNPMPNPTLQLNRDSTVLTTNDDWKETQQTEIQNSGLAPTHNLESAIISTLDPGNYTAILRDKNNAPGIGVVQVYDLDTAADSKLANISTRAFIEPGDNVLFAGIIGGGNGSQPKVLITARGPSLVPFGVPNAISDPLLELHDMNGALITSNNDWQSDPQAAAIAATGVAPTNPKESALLATLRPAENYTAIIKDANNQSGVALVEVYHLQ